MSMRALWDAKARDDAEHEVWAEFTPDAWDSGIRRCLDAIVPALRGTRPRRILDLGCGIGRLTIPMADAFPEAHIIGVDVSAEMLDQARRRTRRHPRIEYRLGDGYTIPIDGPVDVVFSVVVFQHLEIDVQRGYLGEIARILRPGGIARLQSVAGEERTALSQQTLPSEIVQWCSDAGLRVTVIEAGIVYPNWYWVTAKRPR